MALTNVWLFTKTSIDWQTIEKATKNQYRIVSVRPYTDKRGDLPDGFTLTLMVLKDDYDYGVDKNGVPRESNLYRNFDVTILNRKHKLQKGDIVRLIDFDEEHSYAINFDLLLRFRDCEVLQQQGTRSHA